MRLLLVSFLVEAAFAWGEKDRVRLEDVEVITLTRGAWTNGRRSSPVPQLACVGGSGRWDFEQPELVQCYNRGTDGRSIQWECKAEMDNSLRFGKVEVVCEGYDYPDDPYILVGSCGLEYHLELTKEGRERRAASGAGWGGGWVDPSNSKTYDTDYQGSWLAFFFNICFFFFISIFIFIIGIVIYAICKAPSKEAGKVGEGVGGGGWVKPEKVEPNESCDGKTRQRGQRRGSKDRRGSSSPSGENSTTSSGTRTASGFGGTRGR